MCVADAQDPAVAVFERIQQRHPHVDARLFTGGRDGIVNPLVHNLAPAYDAAKYDIIWISTSRIKGAIITSSNYVYLFLHMTETCFRMYQSSVYYVDSVTHSNGRSSQYVVETCTLPRSKYI